MTLGDVSVIQSVVIAILIIRTAWLGITLRRVQRDQEWDRLHIEREYGALTRKVRGHHDALMVFVEYLEKSGDRLHGNARALRELREYGSETQETRTVGHGGAGQKPESAPDAARQGSEQHPGDGGDWERSLPSDAETFDEWYERWKREHPGWDQERTQVIPSVSTEDTPFKPESYTQSED